MELDTSDEYDNTWSGLKVESEARKAGEDDAVMEASDSDHKPEIKTWSGWVVHMPKKCDVFEMTVARICIMQLEGTDKRELGGLYPVFDGM